MPSPSMFIMAIALSTWAVSGSVVICNMPVRARTVACFLLELDGPTSTLTSKDAALRSLAMTISPVSWLMVGCISSTMPTSPAWSTVFILRLSST